MPPGIKELTDKELDRAYIKAAGAMLAQILLLSRAPNSAMQTSLKKLDVEATRLADDDEKIKVGNPQLQQTLGTYRDTTKATQSLILANDDAIQNAALPIAISVVTARVFQGIANTMIQGGRNPITSLSAFAELIGQSGANWIIPGADDFAAGYVTSPEWIAKMEGWGAGYADLTERTLITGIQQGNGPIQIARTMRQHAENIPVSAAENLTRTLQLTSYRDASLAMGGVNNQFIEGKIRIATLDDKTCMACIALHGAPLAVGERVDDHYRGRCTEFYQVLGGPLFPDAMQADSEPGDRRFVEWQTGEDWFASLSPERQAQQNSFVATPAKMRAYQAGTPISSFIGEHTDDVFGHQFVEQSLVGMLGDDAQQFYSINQPVEVAQ